MVLEGDLVPASTTLVTSALLVFPGIYTTPVAKAVVLSQERKRGTLS